MHFIGRAMVKKGWLEPQDLPPADSLDVRITGSAREMLAPGDAPGPGAPFAPQHADSTRT
jgi:hypothetical protein